MNKQYKLIYIEWCDASQTSNDWDSLDEIIRWADEESWIVKQTGFVLKETKEYLLLTSQICNISDDADCKIGGAIKIPATWIIKRIDLTTSIN